MSNQQHHKETQYNAVTLANATELATKVIQSVAGDAVSTNVNGQRLTNGEIKSGVVGRMQGALLTRSNGSK